MTKEGFHPTWADWSDEQLLEMRMKDLRIQIQGTLVDKCISILGDEPGVVQRRCDSPVRLHGQNPLEHSQHHAPRARWFSAGHLARDADGSPNRRASPWPEQRSRKAQAAE